MVETVNCFTVSGKKIPIKTAIEETDKYIPKSFQTVNSPSVKIVYLQAKIPYLYIIMLYVDKSNKKFINYINIIEYTDKDIISVKKVYHRIQNT